MGGDSQTSAGHGSNDSATSLSVDSSGNVYVTGQYMGSSDFGSQNLTTAGDLDAFVVKLNLSGAVQWASRWGGTVNSGTANNRGTSVVVDGNGNVLVLGQNLGATGIDILKFNSAGVVAWSKYVDASTFESCDLAVDPAGNVVVGGVYRGQVDFNPGRGITRLSSGGVESGRAYVTKLNSKGGLIWARSPDRDNGRSIGVLGLAIGAGNSIYVGGYFNGTTDFDPGASSVSRTTAGRADGYLLNLTSAGNFDGGNVWWDSE